MRFETFIREQMSKLNEQIAQAQTAQPADTAQLQQQPNVSPPASSTTQPQPPAQPQQTAQPPADLKARKDALLKKITDKIAALNDVNAITELEKTVQ